MSCQIREMRDAMGVSQRTFAEYLSVPVSTLRKWEQGAASPAPYVIEMIRKLTPGNYQSAEYIQTENGKHYYYNAEKNTVVDMRGTAITLPCSIEGVKRENLGVYFTRLFDGYYELQQDFQRDCRMDHEIPYTLTILS